MTLQTVNEQGAGVMPLARINWLVGQARSDAPSPEFVTSCVSHQRASQSSPLISLVLPLSSFRFQIIHHTGIRREQGFIFENPLD